MTLNGLTTINPDAPGLALARLEAAMMAADVAGTAEARRELARLGLIDVNYILGDADHVARFAGGIGIVLQG